MRRVKSANTAPEMRVRRLVHRLGYSYRLHRKDLPGSPDLAFPGRLIALFVHGCFWHRCPVCSGASRPSSNVAYWQRKFERNVARDAAAAAELRGLGWKVAVIWECQTRDDAALARRLRRALSGAPRKRAPPGVQRKGELAGKTQNAPLRAGVTSEQAVLRFPGTILHRLCASDRFRRSNGVGCGSQAPPRRATQRHRAKPKSGCCAIRLSSARSRTRGGQSRE
jgi:DNA mismatch endonuclease (patch repair protein)